VRQALAPRGGAGRPQGASAWIASRQPPTRSVFWQRQAAAAAEAALGTSLAAAPERVARRAYLDRRSRARQLVACSSRWGSLDQSATRHLGDGLVRVKQGGAAARA
jgi:hypothetical protein